MKKAHLERATFALLIVALLVAGGVVAQSYLLTAGQGGTFDAENGPAVTLGEDYGISGDNPFGADGSVTIQDTTIDGPAGSSATLTDPSSAAPTLSSIDTNGGTIEASTAGIQTVGVAGSISSVTYRDVGLSDSQTTEFEVDGSGMLFVHGFSAGEHVRVNRGGGDATFHEADSNGVVAIEVNGGADLTLVAASEPVLSDPTPTGGEQLSEPPVELAVNVSDADFDSANEEVELEWYVDGELDGTTSVTTNGTATFESSAASGGEHEWYVVATDAANATVQSGSDANPHTFALPSELRLYEETNPNELIDTDEANVTVRFFAEGTDEVIDRSPQNGVIDLQGLPTNQEFIVTVDAEGYEFRRIIVDSLIEQSDVFLLPSDAEGSRVIFELDDQTGEFDPVDTRLYVYRALQQSGNTSYRVIAGDRFGAAAEFPVVLQDGTRYRLRVENDEGETRTLGAYTVSGEARSILPIGRVDIDSTVREGIGFGAGLVEQEVNGQSQQFARLEYLDPTQETDVLNLEVVRIQGGQETLVVEDTIMTPGTRHVGTYQLPSSNPPNATYEARYVADRDGETLTGSERIGSIQEIAGNFGIDPFVLELLGYLAILAMTGLIAVISPAMASIAAVATAAFLTLLGVVAIPGPAIGIAGVTALLYNVARAKGVR